MNKSTGNQNPEKNLRRTPQIMLQWKSHFIANFKYDKYLYRAL